MQALALETMYSGSTSAVLFQVAEKRQKQVCPDYLAAVKYLGSPGPVESELNTYNPGKSWASSQAYTGSYLAHSAI